MRDLGYRSIVIILGSVLFSMGCSGLEELECHELDLDDCESTSGCEWLLPGCEEDPDALPEGFVDNSVLPGCFSEIPCDEVDCGGGLSCRRVFFELPEPSNFPACPTRSICVSGDL